MPDEWCNARWQAPRADAPRSVDVEHVCLLEREHGGCCECSCGATRELRVTSDRHAQYIGWVLGLALRHGIDLRPVVDSDGNYTSRLATTAPDGTVLTFVIGPPPDDWTPRDD